MNLLNSYYSIEFKKIDFHDRKKHITKTNTIIYGPRFSGKSYMLYDLLSKQDSKDYLYIDFNDYRFDRGILSELDTFIDKNSIKIVAIDNFDYSISLPSKTINIVTSDILIPLKGYKKLNLFPLDFEEYISFDTRNHTIEHIFDLYLKNSTFLNMLKVQKYQKIPQLRDNISLMAKSELELEILKVFFVNSGLKLSLFQVYNTLKSKMKVSKDKFYEIASDLVERQYIFTVQKYNQPRSAKKIYAIDFNLKLALSFDKNFSLTFENMIFLELVKRGKKVYYTDYLTFYKPSKRLGILAIAFGDVEQIEKKINKIYKHLKELDITKIFVITIGEEESLQIKDIYCEIMPFWEWALFDEE
jgi:predicted AAA+ superfamily ATPase